MKNTMKEPTIKEIEALVTFIRDDEGNLRVFEVNGDVLGNVEGDVFGNVEGDVCGDVKDKYDDWTC
jgi:hypothetical protein